MAVSNISNYANRYESAYGMQKKVNDFKADNTVQIRQNRQQVYRKDTALQGDALDISQEGQDALADKMSTVHKAALYRSGNDTETGHLSSVSSQSMLDDFEKAVSLEKEEGIKSDTFDGHVRQMVSAYHAMKNHIEEKYADPEKEREYYVADDGSIQELTKEKELEMLDKAYEKHSELMASSTAIWKNLQNFEPQVTYHRSHVEEQKASTADTREDDVKTGEIKQYAYQAFMAAVDKEDRFPFHVNISTSARKELNHIWDYYANIK